MENIFRMSLFMPPISPIRDKISGKNLRNATLTPLHTVDVNEVHKLITSNAKLAALTHEVRNAALLGDDNACRRSDCIEEASGLVVVDIDHLESTEEAEKLRQLLFDDPYLCPALVFVSPTGQGVKAFVPCAIGQSATDGIRWAMNYVHCMYDTDHQQSGKGVDTSGKDLVRSCFLCHDPGALIRITNGE